MQNLLNVKNFRSILCAFLLLSAGASFAGFNASDSQAEIKQVMEQMRVSIIEKDAETFKGLFFREDIPWIGIFNPTKSRKARTIDDGNLVDFIEKISRNPETIEEKFWDIDIYTDGDVASASFKYSFHIGDYTQNTGDESWQLVKTENGWKINSVIYSVNFNPVPKAGTLNY